MSTRGEDRPDGAHFAPDEEVLPGVRWGRPEWVFSPAYWAELANRQAVDKALFRRPDSLIEEVAFCLLGGYGITAEINCAAFTHLKVNGVFENPAPTEANIRALLRDPLQIDGSPTRYRFPNQRARRLSEALHRMRTERAPTGSSRMLRDYLQTFTGIGPKTASWIVRNWTNADDVAILDIHVHRAGILMGLFPESSMLPKDYHSLEKRFLDFAQQISVRASILDALIWSNMRKVRSYRSI